VNTPRGERAHAGESATSARRARAAAREREVFAARLAGATFRQIAHRLGISIGAAHKAMTRALAHASPPESQVREFVVAEVARLDRLQSAWWLHALEGDRDAAAIVIRCIAERGRLLGLHDAGLLLKLDVGRMPCTTPAPSGPGKVSDRELYARAMRLLDAAQEEAGRRAGQARRPAQG